MWEAIVAVLVGVVGTLFFKRRHERKEIEQKVEEVDRYAEREKIKAERTYRERVERARKDVAAGIAARKRTGNPVEDLRNRLDRK